MFGLGSINQIYALEIKDELIEVLEELFGCSSLMKNDLVQKGLTTSTIAQIIFISHDSKIKFAIVENDGYFYIFQRIEFCEATVYSLNQDKNWYDEIPNTLLSPDFFHSDCLLDSIIGRIETIERTLESFEWILIKKVSRIC